MDRRKFIGRIAAGGLGLMAAPAVLKADDDNDSSGSSQGSQVFAVPTNTGITGKVVVVGGGMAGATVAKYLRLWGGTGVDVTLIEKAATYTSNIMSNKVLTGQLALGSLSYAYSTLSSRYGVKVVTAEVTGITPSTLSGSTVTQQGAVTTSGGTYSFDRLIMATGLEFDLMPGMTDSAEYDLIPHAWQAGPQTQLLRNQLLALKQGSLSGDVVITIPKAPYRCPPGPYERACVIADWLYTNQVNSRVIVLDANAKVLVEESNFMTAFGGAYGYVVDYRPSTTIDSVDSSQRAVTFTRNGTQETINAGVLNPIPPQRAPRFLAAVNLYDLATDRSVPVNVLSYESTRVPGIHVIGDSSKTTQPKAGHIGNQQAKTCTDAILRLFQGLEPDPTPVTNSACYTPITASRATWLSAVYQYDPATKTMMVPAWHNGGAPISATAATTKNYKEMNVWFNTLMGDTFA